MDTTTYPPAIRDLLADDRLLPLGPGQPNEAVRDTLGGLTITQLFAPVVIRDEEFARACLSGLWLYHNFLDESHTLSQDIETPTGSFWHGILHRREGDYGNASYWFRRVGRHPVFAALDTAAAGVAGARNPWDPFWFIDHVQAVIRKPEADQQSARQLQNLEWQLLFDYCYREAIR